LVFFPLGVWLARNGAKASEASRSAAAAKAGTDSVPASRPDSEVLAKPKRRTYTAEYKQRILQEAEVVDTRRSAKANFGVEWSRINGWCDS
jgi:hypothetical protein